MSALVAEPAEVAAIAAAIARAPVVAFDLEFLAQDRLVPTLCLVQVAWTEPVAGRGEAHLGFDAQVRPSVALVDPLAVDVRPLVEALAAHPCALAHAVRQDLQLLATRFGAAFPRVVDTQILAAFAGIGDQVGLATLANELVGTSLGKEQQWTNWARRPLSDAQLTYAAADVRYLPAIYALLAARLGPRLAWARAESEVVAADALAAAQVTPETAWRELGTRGLPGPALGAAIALAAWRQRTAIEHDRPLGQVLNDKALLDLARQRPTSPDAVRAVKGLAPLARQHAPDLAALIAAAPVAEVAAGASGASWRASSKRADRWAELLLAIVQLVAEQTGIAARLLATRADAEALARAADEHGVDAARSHPTLAGWRAEVLGPAWLGWLAGRVAVTGDPASATGLALVERPAG